MTDLTDPSWGDPPWPTWLTGLRSHQVSAIDDAVAAFTRTPVVILDAPTGAGKTVIAEGVRRRLGNVRGVYTCTTKTLQDQFLADFDYSRVLKGRSNYPTELGHDEVTCADCTWDGSSCMWCDSKHTCPYEGSKRGALTARVAVLNTAYFLTEANGPGRFGGDNARPLVVLDEADELESALMGWVTVEVGPYWQRRLRIKPPSTRTAEAKSNDWKQWAEHALERATAELDRLPRFSSDITQIRDRQRLWNLCSRLAGLVDGIEDGAWVYDGYKPRRGKDPTILFKPVMVDTIAEQALWRHGEKFLLMSGSVISAQEMADSLGVDDYELVRVPVQWDPARRPIRYTPVANVVHKEKATAYPKLAAKLGEIIANHLGERVLVHTVSYDLAKYLTWNTEAGDRELVSYTNSADREDALARYRKTEGAVLIAPSMDRGVDLKDDDCRVQVVCKIPYPNLGDKQVSKRAHMGRRGKTWYAVQVVRTFVQMVGRGMRHEDDHVVTYVLDEQFERAVLKRKQLVPGHVWEAIQR